MSRCGTDGVAGTTRSQAHERSSHVRLTSPDSTHDVSIYDTFTTVTTTYRPTQFNNAEHVGLLRYVDNGSSVIVH